MKALAILAAAAALAGCASTGVVPIGSGMYMASKQGGAFTYSGGTVKAELYADAAKYCAQSGKQVVPVNSESKDSGWNYASAEIQFRCE
ncbi:hypothetical protein [Variovorax sp. dw_954]|uniref:hypothetical protein n=1 Tax=Variovorax sp. dw_954 TaxID=2720078 RepID=UPI001BD1DB26|nr:hypothetical protein [Variovorax sp. dw_954]